MKTTCATAGGAYLAGIAACVTREAGALNWAAGIAWAAHISIVAADALPGTELLGLAADAVTRRAHCSILTGTVNRAATAIFDDLVTFSIAQPATGFRAALEVLSTSVTIVITAFAPTVTADNGPIAAAPGP